MTKFKGQYRIESARLSGWDYRNAGWYFITICTHRRIHHFGNVVGGVMQLSPIGQTAHQYLADIPHHAPVARVDAFVVMPNHVHVIVVITTSPTDVVPDVETLQCNVYPALQRLYAYRRYPKHHVIHFPQIRFGIRDHPVLQIRRHPVVPPKRIHGFCLANPFSRSYHP